MAYFVILSFLTLTECVYVFVFKGFDDATQSAGGGAGKCSEKLCPLGNAGSESQPPE